MKKNQRKKLNNNLESLFDFVPPQKLSRKLRHIFLSYLRHESDMLPTDIEDTIAEMELLMEFLDEQQETERIN